MDKYRGMNKVDVKVSVNGEVVKKPDKSSKNERRYLKTFLIQCIVSVVLGGLLFGAHFAGGILGEVSAKVKEAVCYNATQSVIALLNKQ